MQKTKSFMGLESPQQYDISVPQIDWKNYRQEISQFWGGDVAAFLRDVETVKPSPKELMRIYAPGGKFTGSANAARAGDMRASGQKAWEQKINDLIMQKQFAKSPNMPPAWS